MANTTSDARVKFIGRDDDGDAKNHNKEIVAIILFFAGVLFALCLLSYNPNDASFITANSASDGTPRNLVGAIGANVAGILLQSFGLAAYPLPLLLIVAAWRMLRSRHVHLSLRRAGGWMLIFIACVGLCDLAITQPVFDRSFEPGGVLGVIIVRLLSSGLGTVGSTIVLLALLTTGILLSTSFSIVQSYEGFVTPYPDETRIDALKRYIRTWRENRRELAHQRAVQRRATRNSQSPFPITEANANPPTAAKRVENFMRDTAHLEATSPANTKAQSGDAIIPTVIPVKRRTPEDAFKPSTLDETDDETSSINAKEFAAEASIAPLISSSLTSVSNGTSSRTASRTATAPMPAKDIEDMLRSASVVRTDTTEVEASPVQEKGEPFTVLSDADKPVEPLPAPDYELPTTDFLHPAPPRHEQADEELMEIAVRVAEKCKEFNVTGNIEHICPGPVVTTYEFKPSAGVKYSRVTGLVDDLCLALKAESVRIDRIPGKAHVGIEVPNPKRETIYLREIIESRQYQDSPSKLTLALGKSIDGVNYVADLAKMPHLLIAGATGTGKSVCLNSLVVSILYKASPEEVKFIMVDPKRLELGLYADIPHLATPIITEPKRAANALKWAVTEMETRYKNLAKWSVRNIDGYNAEIRRRNLVKNYDDEGKPWKPLPYLVILIDELAELMMVSGHEVEESITRLAQMARAVGIHLILATQRPSVDVITGIIKANFPSRISFRVSSKVDSRTILDTNGSEQLLGRGDMLFLPPGTSRLIRVHGAYLDENEVGKIVAHIKAQSKPEYDESITKSEDETEDALSGGSDRDELFDQALRICVEMKRASTSVLQRRLRIGYGRAAAILDAMERDGLIGAADGARPRPVLGRAHETISHWDDLEEANVCN
ncbi:MAG: DNA translocase FtsK [Pyrinomonadaceae bacterium MAG19_C2-C3]|nr:DNA translocase FtsK [Pyrinomonadaceae bacterium MAG19_C2-C3]